MRTRIFKIALLGEGGVGKTALRYNYLGQGFKSNYSMTVGADFAAKSVDLDGQPVTAQIWDLAGQERFSTVRSLYYKGALGALLVFDITRPETYDTLPNWLEELMRNNDNQIVPFLLIGNKGDLRGQFEGEVHPESALAYANALGDWSGYQVPYVETSAKTGDNVDHAFKTLLRNIVVYLENYQANNP